MRHVLIVLALTACAPVGSVDRLTLEYQVGEDLMTSCTQRGDRCPEWLAFKREWEAGVDYLTTFERSLAQHKARVAKGGAV